MAAAPKEGIKEFLGKCYPFTRLCVLKDSRTVQDPANVYSRIRETDTLTFSLT